MFDKVLGPILKGLSGEIAVLAILAVIAIICFFIYLGVKHYWDKVQPKRKEDQEKNHGLIDHSTIFESQCHDKVKSVVTDITSASSKETIDRILEIHEKISELREKYAGKMATKSELREIKEELALLSNKVSELEGKINKNEA